MIKRAILSVSDKTGLLDFARALAEAGIELISTGGTAKILREGGLEVSDISDLTGFPECLDGRVKTLHPHVHGGILARRDQAEHMDFLTEMHIATIDLLVVNLYPFKATVLQPGKSYADCVEQIDIGGPAMLRSAAKNHADVTVVVDAADYAPLLEEIRESGDTTLLTRKKLAQKVFAHTAAYDCLVAQYLAEQIARDENLSLSEREAVRFPEKLTLTYEKKQVLRYGENAHQEAAFYVDALPKAVSLAQAEQLQGKELSYNNISDTAAALEMLREYEQAACVCVKHANPCGIATAESIEKAWHLAYEADPISVFGGIVALNRELSAPIAREMAAIFLEVIIAPSFSPDALEILRGKKNLRLLELAGLDRFHFKRSPAELPSEAGSDPAHSQTAVKTDERMDEGTGKGADEIVYKSIYGGLLAQDADLSVYHDKDLRVVTRLQATADELEDAYFGMQVVKAVKSNGIALVKGRQTLGIGPGQVNRINAVKIAAAMAGEKAKGAILASDAFFPFDDCVREAARHGIRMIVQPGGSIHDQESIDACDELGLVMLFTGQRHFRH